MQNPLQKQLITFTALTFGLATAMADTRLPDLRALGRRHRTRTVRRWANC